MICFLRRSTIDYDIRLRKYIEACKANGVDYIAICWDRLLNSQPDEHEYQLKCSAPYGGGFKNIIALIRWIFFSYFQLFKHWRRYKVIHACNLETYIFVLPLKLFGKKLILDIYDSVNASLEHKLAKKADLLILPHKERLKQISLSEDQVRRLLVVENVPHFKTEDLPSVSRGKNENIIRLSYVGVLEQNIRGIENLLDVVAHNPRLHLNIAGVGGGLEQKIEEYANKCNRITYWGKVDYVTALEIMKNSDLIMALYYKIQQAHIYASPNKFYESLFLSTPIVTSHGTLVGTQVEDINSGYTIGDRYEDLTEFFENFIWDSYETKGMNCSNEWNKRYKNYQSETIGGEYLSEITEIAKQK